MAHPKYPTFSMRDTAYLIMTMHAAKSPSSITGLLLGSKTEDAITINDALPIAHSDLVQATTPVTETALFLCEQRAKKTGQILLGLYFANDNPDDNCLPVLPTRIADRIRQQFQNAIILHLDAKRLAPDRRVHSHYVRPYVKRDGDRSWPRACLPDDRFVVSDRALQLAHRLLGGQLDDLVNSSHVIDFEDHCNDPNEDWLNFQVISRLELLKPLSPSAS